MKNLFDRSRKELFRAKETLLGISHVGAQNNSKTSLKFNNNNNNNNNNNTIKYPKDFFAQCSVHQYGRENPVLREKPFF